MDNQITTLRDVLIAALKNNTRNMENYSYFGKNPGVSEDDYETVTDEVMAYMEAQPKPVAWRTEAVKWIRRKADEQQANNEAYPRHAECYPQWTEKVRNLNWLADDLEAQQESVPFGLKHPEKIKDLVAHADYYQMWIEQVEMNMRLEEAISANKPNTRKHLTDNQIVEIWRASDWMIHEFGRACINAELGIEDE